MSSECTLTTIVNSVVALVYHICSGLMPPPSRTLKCHWGAYPAFLLHEILVWMAQSSQSYSGYLISKRNGWLCLIMLMILFLRRWPDSWSMGRIVLLENSIEIKEMEELDAVSLLLKASCLNQSDEHWEAAGRIVIELGCIPLAVDHAGAYIEAGKCNINTYLKQFFLHHQTLMTDVMFKGASNYNQTVYGTWDLSFKEIERRARQLTTGNAQAAQSAILILQLCAFYHHSNIPIVEWVAIK